MRHFSRYFFLFFGHNSLPWRFWGVPQGGNSSYRPPGPSQTAQYHPKPQEDWVFRVKIFKKNLEKILINPYKSLFFLIFLVFLSGDASMAHTSGTDTQARMATRRWRSIARRCRLADAHWALQNSTNLGKTRKTWDAHMEIVVKIFRDNSKILNSKFWFSYGLISQILV